MPLFSVILPLKDQKQAKMLIKTNAIVLNSLKYGESQLIVDIFTESHGRLSFMQRIPRTSRSGVKKQFFQPLTLLNIEFDYRASQKLQHIKEASVAWPFVSLPFDALKLSIALFVAEFTSYCTRSEQANPSLYLFIENSVRWLDACERGFTNFHIIYMLHLTRFIGFYPNLDDEDIDTGCNTYFDMRAGSFVKHVPVHSDFLRPDEARKIRLLMRLNYTTMRLLSLSRSERNRIVEVILQYYRLHQPAFPDMKSLPVLQQLFG